MQLEVGEILEGRVTGVTKFGAFVELPEGNTGMVHISEVAPVFVKEIRDYVKRQLATEIWQEEQRFENPHKHYLDMTPDYYELKMSLLHNLKEI